MYNGLVYKGFHFNAFAKKKVYKERILGFDNSSFSKKYILVDYKKQHIMPSIKKVEYLILQILIFVTKTVWALASSPLPNPALGPK